MEKNTNQESHFTNITISTMALLAVILALVVLFLGDNILQEIESIYPDWAFPAFFIPWFLLIISSLQKFNGNKNKHRLQMWILKTTIPLFIFTLPFFSQFLNGSATPTTCTDNCTQINNSLFGFEPYCIFLALLFLFLLHFFPSHRLHNKSE